MDVGRCVGVGVSALALGLGLGSCSKRPERIDTVEEKAPAARLIYKDAEGRELTTRDLAGVTVKVNWEIVGARSVPEEARALHREAQAAGGRGDYDRALGLLDQASRIAPDWPYPVYDAAYTQMLKGDMVKARQGYEKVDRMAPRGFFTSKTSLDCLRREEKAALPAGFCKAFEMLEWMDDKAKKRAALEEIAEKYPDFPPVWKELGVLLDDDTAEAQAIDKGLAHEPDGETKGFLLVNKALILDRKGDRDGAVKILGALAVDPGATLSAELMAKATLANLVDR